MAGGDKKDGDSLDQGSIDAYLGLGAGASDDTKSAIQIIVDSQTEISPSIPIMDAIFDRLLGLLKSSIRKFGSDQIDIRLADSSSLRFGSYIQSIPIPSIQTIVKSQTNNNLALIIFDGNTVSTLMDVVFGGTASFRRPTVDGRAFSTVELRTIRRLVDLIVADVNATFAPLQETEFAFEHFETNPRFATIAPQQSVAAIGTFAIEVGSLNGSFQIVIPDGTLDPMRGEVAASLSGKSSKQDVGWSTALARSVSQAHVTLEAVLYEKDLPLRTVLDFAVGDTFMFDITPDRPVELKCEGVGLARCRMGRVDERIAVSIIENIARADKDAGIPPI